MNGVAPCDELLVRRVDGVNINEFALASPLGRGRVGGGVMVMVACTCRRVLGTIGVGEGISSFSSFSLPLPLAEELEGRPLAVVPDRVRL